MNMVHGTFGRRELVIPNLGMVILRRGDNKSNVLNIVENFLELVRL